jgi:2'-hydroxyisoflavone reductase
MRLLILGGTWFLGRCLAEVALGCGWGVTTFSRGLHGSDVPGTVAIRGNREDPGDVARLAAAGHWDVVVDTSGYSAEAVAGAARVLRGRAGRYVLISTVNAYRGWPAEELTDESAVYEDAGEAAGPLPSAAGWLTPSGIRYGQGKAAGERAALREYGSGCLVLRPGVILGRYEYIGRLPWLLHRMERGGRVLAAGPSSRPIQPVDVRDLAAFIVHAAGSGVSGAMNVTAPVGHATYGELLQACREVTGQRAELIWVDESWLAAQDITQWSEIPLWRTTAGAWHVLPEQAQAAGFSCRPLPETVTDTWEWLQREIPVPHERCGCRLFIRSGQAACWYSWRVPPSRSCLRMSRRAIRSGSVIGLGSGCRGAAARRAR